MREASSFQTILDQADLPDFAREIVFAEGAISRHRRICTDCVHETAPRVFAGRAGSKHFVGRRIVRLNIVEVREHFFVEKVCDLAIERCRLNCRTTCLRAGNEREEEQKN